MDCSMPGFPVHHQLLKAALTHTHQVGEATQQFHPVIPFSSCIQSFSTSLSFPMSKFLASVGSSIGGSASASVLPMNIQDWFPLWLTGLISLQSRDAEESSPTPQSKSINFQCSAFFMVQLTHPYMNTGKTIALTRQTFFSKVMSALFNMLPRFVTAFLPRSKHILI